MNEYTEIGKDIILVAGVIFVVLAIVWLSMFSLDKEAARQDNVRQSNCHEYGAAMNKYYDSDVCPPTSHG